jgi:glycerol-3-phosphate dehydrogenase
LDNVLYLGGPNIASEIYNKEYANARICGTDKWRKPLAKFLRQPHFIVWDNNDLITHEVMGGLKNVYAIGAGKICSFVSLLFSCSRQCMFLTIHCSELCINLPSYVIMHSVLFKVLNS